MGFLKLHQREDYKSIRDFPDIELPSFSMITGTNGSGKSHFLEAIANGRIQAIDADGQCLPSNQIYLIRNFNIDDDDRHQPSADTPEQEYNKLIDKYLRIATVQNFGTDFSNQALSRFRLYRHLLPGLNLNMLARLSAEDAQRITNHFNNSAMTHVNVPFRDVKGVLAYLDSLEERFLELAPAELVEIIKSVSGITRVRVFGLTREDFLHAKDAFWGAFRFTKSPIKHVFTAYSCAYERNELEKYFEFRGMGYAKPLSDQEFLRVYGPPPWKLFDNLLESFGLPYKSSPPQLENFSKLENSRNYSYELIHKVNGIRLSPQDLSLGEKIIYCVAVNAFNAKFTKHKVAYPKLILLDEPEANLHPSNVKRFVQSINKTLVERFNINIIMTTHSPTTAALADDEGIFLINASESRLVPITRQRAINNLLSDVPTLALSTEDRIHVFVESDDDAAHYESVYRALQLRLATERSLEFISVGKRSNKGHSGSGKYSVYSVMEALSKTRIRNVFGIVDWDSSNTESDNVFVFGHLERYTIENYIFDPLSICLYLAQRHPDKLASVTGIYNVNYAEFFSMEHSQLQKMLSKVTSVLLERSSNEDAVVQYHFDGTFKLDRELLTMNKERFTGLIFERFQELHSAKIPKSDVSSPSRYITHLIWRQYPKAIPLDFLKIFQRIVDLSLQRDASS